MEENDSMQQRALNILLFGIVCIAIACELFLPTGAMIVVLALAGIAAWTLVLHHEECIKNQAHDAAVVDLLIAAAELTHRQPVE